uniref:Uncharacterized protein n=1 Tax=Ascaris lumbricoides TaxID=6252 RepID=A0A0M3IG62_ASCLU
MYLFNSKRFSRWTEDSLCNRWTKRFPCLGMSNW